MMRDRILHYLRLLQDITSPSGATDEVSEFIQRTLAGLKYDMFVNDRGHIRVRIDGRRATPVLAWASHADTLGVEVGAPVETTMPGHYCTVTMIGGFRYADFLNQTVVFATEDGGAVGTLLYSAGGVHCEMDDMLPSTSIENGLLLCRLDGDAPLPAGTRGAVQANLMVFENGLLRARHLDSKADVAVMLAVLERWKQTGHVPGHPIDFMFNMDEEPGVPTPIFAEDMTHCVALEFIPSELGCALTDIGIIEQDALFESDAGLVKYLGKAMHGTKTPLTYHVTGLMSDATLIARLCRATNKPLPRVATIGFGLDHSHGNERTHLDALVKLAEVVSRFSLPPMEKAP